eukprot:Skav218608  [mRNA]  locus=scaffold3208:41911:43167:+ [translate_table: standard]
MTLPISFQLLCLCILWQPVACSFAATCEIGNSAKSPELLQRASNAALHAPVKLSDLEAPSYAERPQAGGPPDMIHLGVLLKDFYGADLHNEDWEADIVLMAQWYDPRVSGLVPKDQSGRTLSEKQAQELIWTPDVIVTNAELQGQNVISTSFYVSVDGTVNKTQRLLVKIKEDFDGKEFPYDTQVLHVLLASASYMSNDVQLVPMTGANLSDIGEKAFDKSDWTFMYHDLQVFEEDIGSLRKTRMQFQMHLRRDASPYASSTIFPEIMIVVLSYTVFLFPVNPGFAMPRVSSAVIAFLSILTISTRTSQMLPEVRRGLVWMELFEVVCKMLLFIVILLNILVEAVFHSWQQPDLAKQLIAELRIAFPLVAGLSLAACSRATGKHLELFCDAIRSALLLLTALFIFSVFRRSQKYATQK